MSQGIRLQSDLALPSGNEQKCGDALIVPATPRTTRPRNLGRISFLRLFEDVVDELNKAVRLRVAQGVSKSDIAARGGIDPAVLSRALRGRAGTNLRTVAAVLAGTDHRFKLVSVPCEEMSKGNIVYSGEPIDDQTYHYVLADGVWQESVTESRLPNHIQVYSTDAQETPVDA